MNRTVVTQTSERVGWLTLNRPEAYNAITTELALALEWELHERFTKGAAA